MNPGVNFDVVVVGAGPAGSSAARESAVGGAKTLLLEEHEEVGVPQHCAGILYDPDSAKAGIRFLPEIVQAKVNLAKIRVSNVATIGFKASFTIINRPSLDEHLCGSAIESGAELWTGAEAVGVKRGEGGVYIEVLRKGVREIVEAKGVIAADGYRCRIGKAMGLDANLELASCIQYEVEPSPLDSREVMEVYIGEEYAPGGYAWIVPSSDGQARIGLGVRNADRPAKWYLDSLIRLRLQDHKVLKVMGHSVPLGGPIPKTYGDHILLAGDSAGQVIPSSGAGIASSILCGRLAGRTMARAIRVGDLSSKTLCEYQREWKKILGGKFKATLRIKEMLDALSREDVSDIKEVLVEKDVKELIEEEKLFKAAFKIISKKPSLIKYASILYNAKKHGIF